MNKAMIAAARKSRMVYDTYLPKARNRYTDQGQDYYKERYRERMLKFVATEQPG